MIKFTENVKESASQSCYAEFSGGFKFHNGSEAMEAAIEKKRCHFPTSVPKLSRILPSNSFSYIHLLNRRNHVMNTES